MAVLVIAAAVLAGWVLNIALLKTALPNFPEMTPNTAVAFAICGIGLFCLTKAGANVGWRAAAVICGTLMALIGAVTFCEYVLGTNIGLDTLLVPASAIVPGDPYTGRMPPHTAVNFTILGVSLGLLTGRVVAQKISEFLVLFVVTIAFGAALGYLYGAELLYGISKTDSVPVHGILLFFICSCGLLAANRHSRTADLLTSNSLGGAIARRLLPAVVLIPATVGWLRVVGQERGYYDAGFGAALAILSCIALMFWIVLFFSAKVHTADGRRKLAEQELAEKEQRYHELFEYGQSMVCIHELDGTLTTVNPAALSCIGYEHDEVVGRSLREFMPEELQPQFSGFLRQIESEGLADGTFALIAKNGKRILWQYQSILVSEPGKEPYILGNAQDVTKLVEAKTQLQNLTLTDDLTGLYNRRGFLPLVEQQIKLEHHVGTARGLSLMFADLDGLKRINDQYGHQAGSDAIVAFANVLRSALRSADLVARWGGDEFVILTIGTPGETSEMIIDRIHAKLHEHNSDSDAPYDLACSIGITPVPVEGGKSFETLIAEADQAMYNEKRRRKLNLVAA